MTMLYYMVRTLNGTERHFEGTIDELDNWLRQFPYGRLYAYAHPQDYSEGLLVGFVMFGYFVPPCSVHLYN